VVDLVSPRDDPPPQGRFHELLQVERRPVVVSLVLAAVGLGPPRIQVEDVGEEPRVVVLLALGAVPYRVALSVQVRLELPALLVVDVLFLYGGNLEGLSRLGEALVDGGLEQLDPLLKPLEVGQVDAVCFTEEGQPIDLADPVVGRVIVVLGRA
jgi:hypothetical protein